MDDTVSIHIRLRDALRFKADADMDARAIDNIGDKASKTARRLAAMNAAQNKTRVSLGAFSTNMRGGVFAIGALTLGIGKAVPVVLSAAEAVATLAGGAGAAGGVGVLALAQGAGVAKLGIKDLTDALGGNATALKRLSPEMRTFYDTLHAKQKRLRSTASAAMLPGLASGAQSAMRNFGVLNRLVGRTGRTLGGLGSDAGNLLGSSGFGRDLSTVGNANVQIIGNLGHAGLFAASGLRHIAIEAAPLAVWLSEDAKRGAQLADVWLANARASGKMARFFRTAKTDLSLLWSATGHTGHGILNLFGAHDVNGTNTLQSLDRITAKFDKWSNDPKTRKSVGDAVVAEIPKAVGALLTGIADNLPAAGAHAARLFAEGWWHADIWGKLLTAGVLGAKFGVFKQAGKLFGRRGAGGAVASALGARGSTEINPLFVWVVNSGIGGPGGKPHLKGPPGTVVPTGVSRGSRAAGLLRRVLPFAGPIGVEAALLELAQGTLPNHNLPTRGGAGLRREAAGRPAFVQNPFGHAPDAQVKVEVPVIIDGRELARIHARAVAQLNAGRK